MSGRITRWRGHRVGLERTIALIRWMWWAGDVVVVFSGGALGGPSRALGEAGLRSRHTRDRDGSSCSGSGSKKLRIVSSGTLRADLYQLIHKGPLPGSLKPARTKIGAPIPCPLAGEFLAPCWRLVYPTRVRAREHELAEQLRVGNGELDRRLAPRETPMPMNGPAPSASSTVAARPRHVRRASTVG